jgi:hypothetical protein
MQETATTGGAQRQGTLGLLATVETLFGATAFAGAILYYAGRRYLESYYATWGIPSGMFEFTTTDYLFKATVLNPLAFLFAIGVGYVGWLAWLGLNAPTPEKAEKADKMTWWPRVRSIVSILLYPIGPILLYLGIGFFSSFCSSSRMLPSLTWL